MNDRWLDAAAVMVADDADELADVQARMEALPAHSPVRAALALRAADLGHRIAAACRVLDAYAAPGAAAPGGPAAGDGGGALPSPAVPAAMDEAA